MTREELQASFTAEHGPTNAAAVMKLALPTAHISLDEVSADSIPSGASRYGGEPDVPIGFVWPTCKTRRGHKPEGLVYPLTFVAQINFAEAAPCIKDDPIWPSDGTLMFFFDSVCMPAGIYDPSDAEGLRLVYVPAGTPLQRMKAPPHTPPSPCDVSKFVLNARRISFQPGWTLPEPDSESERMIEAARESDFDCEQSVLGPPYDWKWWQPTFLYSRQPRHRLGGFAAPEQSDPCRTCAQSAQGLFLDASGANYPNMKKLGPGLPEAQGPWRLLLQFDLAEAPESPCGYDGTQFFLCASEASIRSRSFRAAWWSWDQD